jgi:predicted O-linked N-acetylglucosamine transferase (SPINDLY family)
MDHLQKLQRAVQFLQKRQFIEAETILNEILSAHPEDAGVHHFLGMLYTQTGRMDSGLKLMRRSVELAPNFAEYHVNLAEALYGSGALEAAIAQCRYAISLNPDTAWAYHALGRYLHAVGDYSAAAEALLEAVRRLPMHPQPLEQLARCLADSGQTDLAIGFADDLVRRFPQHPSANTVRQACLQAANSTINRGEPVAQSAQAQYELGIFQDSLHRHDPAAAAYTAAVTLDPKHAPSWANLGTVRFKQGLVDDALRCYARATEADPSLPAGYCNEMFVRWYSPRFIPQETFEFHRDWARRYADPLNSPKPIYTNLPDPNRRLRIGYVSANFSVHVVGMYLDIILSHHDRSAFEIFCYSDVERADPATARFQTLANQWRNTVGLSHEKFADLVRKDGINILIDTNLFTPGSRILAFARRPAPVQVNYLAYPATSGIAAMDYCLTDPYLDPPEMSESLHTEKLIRLPHSYWCYPVPPQSPPISEPPSCASGHITFGSLNNFAKINDQVLQIWSAILNELPNSRLALVLRGGLQYNAHLPQMFERNGIPVSRVDLHNYRPRYDFFALHNQIDITLDPFPYNGPTTGLDSMWMGVPIITLAGSSSISRGGVSVLSNVGLLELIADSPSQYVQIATSLAKDASRLAAIRSTLRDRMLKSPLCDAQTFTRDIEAAFRQMWHDWCAAQKR